MQYFSNLFEAGYCIDVAVGSSIGTAGFSSSNGTAGCDVVLAQLDAALALPDVALALPDVALALPDVALALPDVAFAHPDVHSRIFAELEIAGTAGYMLSTAGYTGYQCKPCRFFK